MTENPTEDRARTSGKKGNPVLLAGRDCSREAMVPPGRTCNWHFGHGPTGRKE